MVLHTLSEIKKPPVLKTKLTNMTFPSGKAAVLECKVESDSVPNISWSKNGSVITDTGDLKPTYQDGVAKLEIGNSCAQDSGKYDCVIKNEFGEVTTSCLLTIQSKYLGFSNILSGDAYNKTNDLLVCLLKRLLQNDKKHLYIYVGWLVGCIGV